MVKACDFTQLLVDQQPIFDKLILEDITPTDSWIGNMKTGSWANYTGTEHTLDRFTDVYPDTTKAWERVQVANCLGNPCDANRYEIGFGAKRISYFLERMALKTKLLCFDQEMHITHAQDHLSQIISNVLRPASMAVMSMFMRKRALLYASKKWYASRLMSDFTFVFSLGPNAGDGEIFFDASVAPTSIFKLTPQMLQRRFEPLMRVGYAGKNPFKEMGEMIELVADMDTLWELDHLGGSQGVGGIPSILGNWRFEQWGAVNKYWKYGFNGSIGNYLVRIDHSNLRFNFVRDLGAAAAPNRYRYQVILPYKNGITGGAGGAPGLGRQNNPDFDLAQFRIGYIWHKDGMEALVSDATPVNKEMPYGSRDFGGGWQFVMDNLGGDSAGRPIENFLRNKGMFVADFKLGIRPLYTEFVEAILYRSEPQCVIEISPCATDPGYPTQTYTMANPDCGTPVSMIFLPVLAIHNDGTASTYEILGNTILCNSEPVNHAAITGTTTLQALVNQLNALVPSMGLWGTSGTTITLSATDCDLVVVPFLQQI